MNRSTQYIVAAFLLLATISSCKKDDPNAGLEPPRLFKPQGISVKTTATTATVTWSAPILATGLPLSYTAEFSQDSTFETSEFSIITDTLSITVSDEKIKLRQKYYVRIKAENYDNQPESKWERSSAFSINGEQWFFPLRDVELNENSVTLRWTPNNTLTTLAIALNKGKIDLYQLTPAELSSGVKLIPGLIADTTYIAEIFAGTKSKGFLFFKTLAPTVYTTVLNAGDDLGAAITAAANNAVIGLKPGTYTGSSNFAMMQKTVTIKSLSNNPADTKVAFKEFTLRGNGAGINLQGIELDGTPGAAAYFINLTGAAADGEKCAYTQVSISNCIVHGLATSFFRADRGAAAGDYTMNQIIIKNALVYDIGVSNYSCFHLNELAFNTMQVTKSTFYNIGRQLLSISTVLPSVPSVTFDNCTFNNFGSTNLNAIMNAGSNPVKLNLTNSIIANIPRPGGTVLTAAINATAAGTGIVFSNNNTFNLTNGAATPAVLTWPTTNITQVNNQLINLGWTASTIDFTLPVNSVLRTVSSAGGAIGDPRWAY
ncbi:MULTISPECIES: DUF4957 domain-containing protein [Niastella]|uniref:DUF4957 domain-containing protein n=1 Tax=Niastella soli TaxID=2821487 RepID=A0ABS3YRV9_9BACT|nr:DUF4957 domain-containing protein [Niastella soli]MBO9200615.1 DUF4957 domain-containing protein [Niastella soli]